MARNETAIYPLTLSYEVLSVLTGTLCKLIKAGHYEAASSLSDDIHAAQTDFKSKLGQFSDYLKMEAKTPPAPVVAPEIPVAPPEVPPA